MQAFLPRRFHRANALGRLRAETGQGRGKRTDPKWGPLAGMASGLSQANHA